MKKSIIKKIFIRLSKILGYEIIDQNEFYSPTLEKNLNEDLSTINQKSIVLPLGEVSISRKVNSILIILRANTKIDIWDQNKKRIFEKPKVEYTSKSISSLIKSIVYCKTKYPNIKIKTLIVDDDSDEKTLIHIKKTINSSKLDMEIINFDKRDYDNIINKQKNLQTFGNLSSLLHSFELGKKMGKDLVFFLEDDYIHFEPMLEEMIASYERISSQTKKELFMCPADYPYLYMNNEKSNILIGNKRHWRTIDKTLCTFMTSIELINKYWDNFYSTCLDRNEPFEKYLNEIYKKELCISPLKSLSVHMTNVNSSYGLSPFINYKKLWNEN
tara:strand:+ start:223 stop:1209 length:987 start_codon:yes stop_codon:yes gene_type:complete